MANQSAGPFGKPDRAAEHMLTCDQKANHTPENCPSSEPEPSTAQILGAYRRELLAEGIEADEIRMLVIEAARTLYRHDVPIARKHYMDNGKRVAE